MFKNLDKIHLFLCNKKAEVYIKCDVEKCCEKVE